MRRGVVVAGAVAGVVVVGWTAFWFAGRSEVEARVDAEIARLEAEGTTVAYEDRGIGGFPFGYAARFEGLRVTTPDGHVLTMPRLDAALSLFDAERLVVTLPPEARAEIAETAPGTLPGPVDLAFEDARVVFEPAPETVGGRRTRVEAASIGAVRGEADAAGADAPVGAVEAFDVDAVLDEPGLGAERRRLSLRLGRLDALASGTRPRAAGGAGAQRFSIDARVADIALSADLDPAAAMTPDGRVEIDTGLAHVDFASRDRGTIAPGGDAAAATEGDAAPASAGSGRSRVTVARLSSRGERRGGVVETETTLETVGLLVEPADPEARVRGALAVERVAVAAVEPIARTPSPQPFRLGLAVEGLSPDGTMWRALDPDGALARGPIAFDATIEGRTREGRVGTGQAALMDLGEATASVRLDALGARLDGEGRLTVPKAGVSGAPPAVGEARLVLEDSMALLRDLTAAGYLTPQATQVAMILADNYARPGDTPETLIVDLAVADGMLSINGAPVAPVEALPLPR